ncbi:helix-turn-helix transcriptional regulator [Pullulanibacillus sp. KACC 23026]|uniref:helix-turn-helix transcriptional regulator n=1 Tax=Pullulanibacillus sp. KACC 23026 TaxID=3028315 RepID=UPI0023AFE851|nr:helix-turn-helix transcriptional regulator [Pullulanibacillus sp. KACC 23026]WEG12373.1 helix-turn-helix transcriptional regulator [Pullulanibacillus sp. KACC 23026]
MVMEPSYTTEDIANLLKVSKLTVYDLIKKGELPAYRVGRQMRIDVKDFDVYKSKAKQIVTSEVNQEDRSHPAKNEGLASIRKNSLGMWSHPQANRPIIITGQDVSLDVMGKHLEKQLSGIRTLRSNKGSMESLIELFRGEADIVSTHLYDGDSKTYNLPYIKKLLSGYRYLVIHFLKRKAGLYVQKGNPLKIKDWKDLGRDQVTLINREKGSGARVLLDEQLRLNGLLGKKISGYDHEETSHFAVAAVIANGDADVGVGSEKPAKQVGIEFIPLIEEHVDLVILKNDENESLIQQVKNLLQSTAFKNELQYLGDYNLTETGEIVFESE